MLHLLVISLWRWLYKALFTMAVEQRRFPILARVVGHPDESFVRKEAVRRNPEVVNT